MGNKDEKFFKSEKKKNVLRNGKEKILHNINVGNMILNAFKSKPDFVGQINAATEERITFQQMREKSVKLAMWLQCISYKSMVISICTSDETVAYIPFLAGLYINAVVNPWDENYINDYLRILFFLVEYKPEVIFIDGYMYDEFQRAIRLLNEYREPIDPTIVICDKVKIVGEDVCSLELILNDDNFDETDIDEFICEETKPTDIAGAMFSSNATSYPGKTYLRHFAFTFPSNQEVPAMSSGDIGLWYGSLTWIYSMILTVRSIVSYVTVIKFSEFYDEEMYNTIEKYKVNWVFLESSMCNRMFQTDIRLYDLSSLKQLVYGDLDLRPDIYKKFNKYLTDVSITQVYSISEAFVIAAYQRDNKPPSASSGYVANNIQLTILDIETKKIVSPLKPGEINCELVCKWCNPRICKSSHCSNYGAKENNIKKKLFSAIISKCYSTGDFGFCEKGGKLFFIDKIRNIIKYQKYYIPPQTIEAVLEKHPAVSEVVVTSIPHSFSGQYPVAYVKTEEEVEVTEELKEELEELVEKILPDMYRLRGGIRFTTEIPHLPNGKIDRILVQYW